MSNLKITPIVNKTFGAVVTDVKLGKLNQADFQTIKIAFLEYGFLVFPEQRLTDEENIAFGERFGKLEFGALPIANQKKREDGSWGEIMKPTSATMIINVGNEAWHTDSTYRPISSKCALLFAVSVPASGGETELADTRAGYATLDQATKDRIENLSAYHSNEYSQAHDVGFLPPRNKDTMYHGEAYLRPLVKTHPDTGVKNLFVGRHAFGIPGMGREESRELLKSLVDFVVSDEARVYTHKWQAGDLLLWDNRALLHRAKPYDYSKPRVLIATRVQGDPVKELAYNPTDPEAKAGRDALAAELDLLRQETAGKRYEALVNSAAQ